jgi:hypothetical protein
MDGENGDSVGLTSVGSSKNVNKKSSSNSSEFSIRSAYCPTIQIIAAFASGSSSTSRCSHSTPMTDSYWFGYRRKMSLMTTTASWTTYETLVAMRARRTAIERSDEAGILMASRPMERTALRTKSTSTSEAYLRKHREYKA